MVERKFGWRCNGAVFAVVKNLEDINHLLRFLYLEDQRIAPLLEKHFEKFDNDNSDEALDEFSDITEKYSGAELSFRCSVDTAILLAIIDLESIINQFTFYNLGEIPAESMETLSMLNKMEIIHRILNLNQFKGTKPYESLKSLVSWRNKYAHGKNLDKPPKPLRKNHIEEPDEYKNTAEDKIKELIEQIENYLNIIGHLELINSKEEIILGHSDHYWIEQYIENFRMVKFEQGYPLNICDVVKDRLQISIVNYF